jgi:hypothetical protein
VARWTKKSLTFPITSTQDQIDFIEQLKRKLKLDFHIKADQRGVKISLRGDSEMVRSAVSQAQRIFRDFK